MFPDLNRPRVVIMTEAPGMAPEEVETLITFPLETALNGATGVQDVRSSSGVGLSVIYVEFDWGTDIFNDRQIVNERLALVADRLPEGVTPQLAPISSIMGQIQIVGMWSEGGKTSPMELRTLADWVVRQRLLTIPGVSQVVVMGGERKQFQVLVDPNELASLRRDAGGGQNGPSRKQSEHGRRLSRRARPNEYLVRSLGRVKTVDELGRIVVVKHRDGQSVRLSQVARIVEGPQVKRGDSSAFARTRERHIRRRAGRRAHDQQAARRRHPRGDASTCSRRWKNCKPSLPPDIRILPELVPAEDIHRSGDRERHGGPARRRHPGRDHPVSVSLMNLRTTFITLTAIPLSIVMTALVFACVRTVDQHDDAGRIGGRHRRTGR